MPDRVAFPIVRGAAKDSVYAYVAHSAGALTVAAARFLKDIEAEHYVFICAPSHPFPATSLVSRKPAPRKAFIAGQFNMSWAQLERGTSFAGFGTETLLVYDTSDRFVAHEEADKIKAISRGGYRTAVLVYGSKDGAGHGFVPECVQQA